MPSRTTTLIFEQTTPDHPAAKPLLRALSAQLAAITGSSGEASFDPAAMAAGRSVFLLAWSDREPIGCGALREVDRRTCEIKRMYSARARFGIGGQLLAELERRAQQLGYERALLETRRINTAAVSFYLKHGYAVIPNYGKYAGRAEAICFGKRLSHPGAKTDNG